MKDQKLRKDSCSTRMLLPSTDTTTTTAFLVYAVVVSKQAGKQEVGMTWSMKESKEVRLIGNCLLKIIASRFKRHPVGGVS